MSGNVTYGPKTIDCLQVAELFHGIPTPEFLSFFSGVCGKWSEKAVHLKLRALEERGYIINGRLTSKGRQALETVRQDRRQHPDVPQPDGRRHTDQA